MGENSKSELSKNVLQMKDCHFNDPVFAAICQYLQFMQRSVLRIEKEKTAEEQQYIIDDEHWVLDLPETHQKESKYIIEPSYSRCENLMFERLSFKGFNRDVEKLMKSQNLNLELEEAVRKENEINVDDEDMAERYESLIGTISRKFAQKRKRQEDREGKIQPVERETVTATKKFAQKRPRQGDMEENHKPSKYAKKSRTFIKPADDD